MEKIKVSDIFYSLQGEGRYIGVPSVFVKTFGCNFTCDGFGMPRGEKSNERNLVAANIPQYKQYRDLPAVNTGCDSYASWDTRFKDFSPMVTTDSLAQSILSILPHKEWREEHLVITGGEPLLGWQRAIGELLKHDLLENLQHLTFETNGTQELSPAFERALKEWNQSRFPHISLEDSITFSVSPKLSSSGEEWVRCIQPKVISEYERLGNVYLKFVIASRLDADEAMRAVAEYRSLGFSGQVYFMPVGSSIESYRSNCHTVADLALKYGVCYSPRLHLELSGNSGGSCHV